MARKSGTASTASSSKRSRRKRSPIAEPFQIVSSATIARDAPGARVSVPMLVLYGEWLEAIGFPIGSAAVVTTDEQGELALHRIGLRLPRRLTIRAMPR